MDKEDDQLVNKAIRLINLVLDAKDSTIFCKRLNSNRDSFYHIFYADNKGRLKPIFVNIFEVETLNKVSRILRIAHTINGWNTEGLCFGFYGDRANYKDIRDGLDLIMRQLDGYLSTKNKERIDMMKEEKQPKILFSHSTNDRVIVEAFIQLLESINIPEDNIICSSIPPYNIQVNENIYEFLRNSFNEKLHVLFFLSEEYYKSVPSLNEMGACWLAQKSYTSIIMPEFSFGKIKGVIDPNKAGVDLNINNNERMLRSQLRELRDLLTNLFSLQMISESKWDRYVDNFIEKLKNH